MTVDRSKLKATPTQNIKSQESEVKNIIYNDGERTPYVKIKPGTNKLRIFPAHPGTSSFTYPYSRWWLPKMVTYEKNGEEVTEMKKRPVWNAKIHGNAKQDIVEEYVKFVTQLLTDTIDDEKELEDKLKDLTHWKKGLKAKYEWIAYVNQYIGGKKHFGFWTYTPGIKKKLNELAITEDDADEPISVDPFTDPDDGKAIIVKYDPNAERAQDKYKVNIEFRGNYALTDDEIEQFLKLKSLEEQFVNVYRRRDFDLAVEGLQLFDEQNNFGAFEHDEWLAIVEKLQQEWPADEDEDEQDEDVETVEDEVEASEPEDEFEGMDRTQLKRYIKKNELPIIVKRSMSDDDIRDEIRNQLKLRAQIDETEPDEVDDVEDDEQPESEPEVTQEAPKTASATQSKLDEVRNRLKLAKQKASKK